MNSVKSDKNGKEATDLGTLLDSSYIKPKLRPTIVSP